MKLRKISLSYLQRFVAKKNFLPHKIKRTLKKIVFSIYVNGFSVAAKIKSQVSKFLFKFDLITRGNTAAQKFFWFSPVMQHSLNVHGCRGSGHLERETLPQHKSTLQINNPSFQRIAFIVHDQELYTLKTQSQIQRKTVGVYKLLFLIMESTGGGILASFVGPL